MPQLIHQYPPLGALARLHVLFESIHPFSDGNGRAGRILLNYLAVSLGWPPIIIKGMEQTDRERYYQSLEAGDVGFHRRFPPPQPCALLAALGEGDFGPLEVLLHGGVLPQLETLIVRRSKPRPGRCCPCGIWHRPSVFRKPPCGSGSAGGS